MFSIDFHSAQLKANGAANDRPPETNDRRPAPGERVLLAPTTLPTTRGQPPPPAPTTAGPAAAPPRANGTDPPRLRAPTTAGARARAAARTANKPQRLPANDRWPTAPPNPTPARRPSR